jgi:hypothetical protein
MKINIDAIMGFIKKRKRQYQLVFNSYAGQDVMIDLARFCRANETCFHEDARMHAVLEGRREVFLRIQQHLNLTEQQLFDLYSGQHYQQGAHNDVQA